MGKVLEPWVSQQKLLGNKLVTKLAELFGTILGNLELFDYFMGECLLTFFFFSQLSLWEMSITPNFYIRFHKNKIKSLFD